MTCDRRVSNLEGEVRLSIILRYVIKQLLVFFSSFFFFLLFFFSEAVNQDITYK